MTRDPAQSATALPDDGDAGSLAPGYHPGPSLRIVITGGAIGEVGVVDGLTGDPIATCTHSCVVAATEGQDLLVTAATPSVYGGMSGACTTSSSEPSCDIFVGTGRSTVTATFTTAPGEQVTLLPGGSRIMSAAYDSANNLVVASNGVTKFSPGGCVIWQVPLTVCEVVIGPDDTIYAETRTSVVKLDASGATLWTQPLDPNAVGCGTDDDGFDGFVHNLAVGSDGAVAIHGNTGVARWDTDGNLSWSVAVQSLGGPEFGVAIDPAGIVNVGVTEDEPLDVIRFAADGTALPGEDRIAQQYHGMFVIDGTGRLLATSSGHSEVDALGRTLHLRNDADFVPNGIAAAGTDVAWFYEASDNPSFARDWTLNRYRSDGSLAFTHQSVRVNNAFEEVGTSPHDIAGSPDGHIAIVGEFNGPTSHGVGWITTFQP